jgi:hypothetical protein
MTKRGDAETLDSVVRLCQRLHSSVGDGFFWQRENPKQGGRMWLRSQVPRDIVEILDRLATEAPEVLGVKTCAVLPLWHNIRSLIIVLNQRAENLSEDQLNRAMPLLHMASGVAWHWLRALLSVCLVRHVDLDDIEPLELVLERAGRGELIGISVAEIGEKLVKELTSAAASESGYQ